MVFQDGYAVVSADGPGDYDVAFEALAGTAAGQLKAGSVAYITTGTGTGSSWTPSLPPGGYPPLLTSENLMNLKY